MLYGKLEFNFLYTSVMLYPNLKNRLLIGAKPHFYMINDNLNISLGISDCSQNWLPMQTNGFACKHSRGVQLKGDFIKDFYHSRYTKPPKSRIHF